MVFPLFLGLLAAGGAGAFGRSFLERMQAESETEAQQARWQAALNAGYGGAGPGQAGPQVASAGPMNILPSEYGQGEPGAQQVTPGAPAGPGPAFDYQSFALSLAQAGDPMGMEMLARLGAAEHGFGYDQRLQSQRDRAAMERLRMQQEARPTAPPPPTVKLPGGIEVPFEPTPVGSKAWSGLVDEGYRLNRVRDVLDEFRGTLMESGTEGRFSGDFRRLTALTEEMVGIIGLLEEAGAIQEGESERFKARIPKVASEVPEFLRNEAGVLDALGSWYNNQAQAYNLKKQFTAYAPGVRLFPTSDLVPPGWRTVTDEEIGETSEGAQPIVGGEGLTPSEALRMSPEELRRISSERVIEGVPMLGLEGSF